MRATDLLILFAIVLAFDFLAFAGLRIALGLRGRRFTAIYWLGSAAVTGWAAGAAYFTGEISEGPIVALVAMYLPKLFLAAFTLAGLLWRLVFRTRGRLLPRAGLALAVLTLGMVAWGTTLGRGDLAVYRHEVALESLPPEFDGLRIVHLSDIHARSLGRSGPQLAARIVEAVNAERPDLVVYTGDYGGLPAFAGGPEILGRLRARLGKYAVLGNHDFGRMERASDNWASAEDKRRKIEALSREFASRGFKLLVNDAAALPGDAAVLGVSVFDPHHGFFDADLAAAERAAGGAAFRLLIAHTPEYWETVVLGKRAVELTLVGHTHGAQVGFGVGPFVWSPAALHFTRWGGLYREGRQYLNVNRGVGCVGLPFRFNMPADVSVIVLRPERAGRVAGRSAGSKSSGLLSGVH